MKNAEGPKKHDYKADIQKEQNRIDNFDGNVDNKIEGGAQDQSRKNKLTDIYVTKVNTLQSKIGEVRRRIEVQKNMRSDNWQNLEKSCSTIEKELYLLLKDAKYNNLKVVSVYANKKIGDYIQMIDSTDTNLDSANSNPEDRKKNTELLEEWGVIAKDNAERTEISAQIVSKYGKEALRTIEENMVLFEDLPVPIREKLFGISAIDKRQIVGQMLAMNPEQFMQGPTGFALGGVEEAVNGLRERTLDAISDLQKELNTSQKAKERDRETFLSRIENEDEEGQKISLRTIEMYEERAAKTQEKMKPLRQLVSMLDMSLVTFDISHDQLQGNQEEADRTLLTAYEKYGDAYKQNPGMGSKIDGAQSRLDAQGTLTEVDKKLIGNDSSEAIASALKQQEKLSGLSDIADQIKAKETFRVSKYSKGSDLFKYTPTWKGRKQTFLLTKDVASIRFQDGRFMRLFLESDAKHALQNIPKGCQPVILKKVKSISWNESGGSGRYHAGRGSFLKLRPYESILNDASEVGYVDKDGKIFSSGGEPVDMSTNTENKNIDFINQQVTKQKSFRTTTYRHSQTLKKFNGEPYTSKLISIETQSGQKVDGVTVSIAANAILSKTPPKGYTLVLNRVPDKPVFTTTYSKRTKRGRGYTTKSWQHISHVDKITTADLAYAKIEKGENGDEKIIVLNTKEEEQANESLPDLDKKRDENSRDVMRAIDKDPAIKTLQSDAGEIAGPLQQLQQVFQAAQGGPTRYSGVVNFARNEARSLRTKLQDPKVRQNLAVAQSRLRELKGSNLGVALVGVEQELDAKIKQIDEFAAILSNKQIIGLLDKMLDKSQFDEDTWGDLIVEGIKIIAVIAIAVAVAVATAGAGLIVMAAASTAAGIIAYELAEEAEFAAYNLFDSDVTSGDMSYKKRSKLGSYYGDGKMYDAATGEYREMSFIEDVANPYAKQFVVQFAMQLATMGILKATMPHINKMAQSSTMLNGLAKNSALANRVLSKLSQLTSGADDVTSAIGKKYMKELGDELLDEIVWEKGAEVVLTRIDARLGAAAALIVGVAKGFRPRGSKTLVYNASVDTSSSHQMVTEFISEQGYTPVSEVDGIYTVSTYDGHTITIMPDVSVDTEINTEATASHPTETEVETNTTSGDVTGENVAQEIAVESAINTNTTTETVDNTVTENEKSSKTKAERAAEYISSPEVTSQLEEIFEGINIAPKTQAQLIEHIKTNALNQQIDNPEQYVSHGFDHTLRVKAQMENILEAKPQIVSAIAEKYNIEPEEARMLTQILGLYHDFGYATVPIGPNRKPLSKALHAVTGAAIASDPKLQSILTNCFGPEAKIDQILFDLKNGVLFHSADKVEVYKDTKIKIGHGIFIIDSKNVVDVYNVYRRDGNQTPVEIHASKENISAIQETLVDASISLDSFKFVETTGEKFAGRLVDLKQKGDELLALEFKKVDSLQEPLEFLIRFADNLDIAPDRFSEIQGTQAFREIYHKFGEGTNSGLLLKDLESLQDSVRKKEMSSDQCIQKSNNILGSDKGSDICSSLGLDIKISTTAELNEFIEKYKSSIIETVLTEEKFKQEVDDNGKEQIAKIARQQNSVSFRHFGGCEAIHGIELQGSTLEVTVDSQTYDELNKTTVTESTLIASGEKTKVIVGVGEYQIWRTYEAHRSLTNNGASITIRVMDTDGNVLVEDFAADLEAKNQQPNISS